MLSWRLVLVDLLVPVALLVLMPGAWAATTALALALTTVNRASGLYRRRFHLSVLDELPALLMGIAAGIGAATIVPAVLGTPFERRLDLIAAALLATVLLGRGLVYRIEVFAWKRDPRRVTRIVLVGDGGQTAEVADRILPDRSPGFDLIGIVGSGEGITDADVPILGDYADLDRVLTTQNVDVVLLTHAGLQEWELARSVRQLPRHLEVYSVPPGYSLGLRRVHAVDTLGGVPVIPVTPQRFEGAGLLTKRMIDILVSLTALVVLSPLLLAVAIAVKVEQGRGVIFRQERIGRDGEPFTLYKFTSMRPADPGESDSRWTIAEDDRVGSVGRFIRTTSLDELPQLVNILRGDMSLVGPRPERPFFVERYRRVYPGYEDRHRAPVGLTGHAAVNGLRGDTSIEERANFDNQYIDTWSLWADVKIVVRTIRTVLGRHGR